MPLTIITLRKGKSPEYLAALSEGIHDALTRHFEVPADDRFQLFDEKDEHAMVIDRHYRGGPRTGDFVLVRISAGKVRNTATRQTFYRRLAERLALSPGLDPENLMIIIHTNTGEEWSFGGGRMAALEDTPC